MKYIYNKSKRNFILFDKFELRYIFYKSLFYNLDITNKIRQYFFVKLKNKRKKFFFSFLKSRCYLDMNSRHLFKIFKLSRYQFKYLASMGYLSSIKKK
jgi:ribosomal protein S14